jgi:hypothetical protein
MGVSYFYLNYAKGQFYHCGLLGWSSRFSAIGSGPGARALAILLSERGTWGTDRISVVADGTKEFDKVFINSLDIEVEVELMLIDVDGLEWIEAELEQSSRAFVKMCAFALLLRRSDILNMLDKKFGVGKWQQRYQKHLKANTDTWSQRIIEAQSRGLRLLT